jgi:hypothetical protein
MKNKNLTLLIIFAGIIVTIGCLNVCAQPFLNNDSGGLYGSVFSPYGVLDYKDSGPHPHVPFFKDHHRGPRPAHDLKNATFILDKNIERAEDISARLEAGVKRYKAEGKDVSELEASLNEYNSLIKQAKQYRESANNTSVYGETYSISTKSNRSNNSHEADSLFNITAIYSNGTNYSSESDKREYLVRSQKTMMEANSVLEEVFEEFKSLTPGDEELNNTSRLNATGHGRAFLMGSFTLNLHIENGKLTIPDLSPDAEINITGNYTFENKDKREHEVKVYHIKSADVKISGSHKTVMFKGANITINANGEGYSDFVGKGTYRIEEPDGLTIEEENWEAPFFEHEDRDRFGLPEELNSEEFERSMREEINAHEFELPKDNVDYVPSEELKSFEVEIANELNSSHHEVSSEDFKDETKPEDFEPSGNEIDEINDMIKSDEFKISDDGDFPDSNDFKPSQEDSGNELKPSDEDFSDALKDSGIDISSDDFKLD